MVGAAFPGLRLRLVQLGVAVGARAFGGAAVRLYIAALMLPGDHVGQLLMFIGVTALPILAVAPFAGFFATAPWRSFTFILSTIVGLGIILAFAYKLTDPLILPALLALETACFTAAQLAAIPSVAMASTLSAARLQSLFSFSAVAGTILGAFWTIAASDNHELPLRYLIQRPAGGMPDSVQAGIIGYGVAFILLLSVKLPGSDRVDWVDGVIRLFIRNSIRILKDATARRSWIALVIVLFLAWLGAAVLFSQIWRDFGFSMLAGLGLASLSHHAFRSAGFSPMGSLLALISMLILNLGGNQELAARFFGLGLGLMLPGLLTLYFNFVPGYQFGQAAAFLNMGWAMALIGYGGLSYSWRTDPNAHLEMSGWWSLGLSAFLLLFTLAAFLKSLFEMWLELTIGGFYKIRTIGPGYEQMPPRGPMLIFANHAAWFDPLWIGKHLPPPATPMMTGRFYDIRLLSWLMKNAVRAIRVPETASRRNAPELQEAIAALDRGEAVIIFPEGWLRRKTEQPIRRFARGIWEILKARPNTPAYAAWIEGNWGSYWSWFGGPPTKNKKIDKFRPIDIAVLEPRTIDPALLADHMKTRYELMRWMLEARALLNLPPIDLPPLATEEPAAQEKPS